VVVVEEAPVAITSDSKSEPHRGVSNRALNVGKRKTVKRANVAKLVCERVVEDVADHRPSDEIA
jgi:hypothetical protein